MSNPLFDTIRKLDRQDTTIYNKSTPETRTKLDTESAWLIPQWLTGSHDESDHQTNVVMFDVICNEVWTSLKPHPELRMKLLALVSVGTTRHKFYRPKTARLPDISTLAELLWTEYLDMKSEEMFLWCRNTDSEEFELFLDAHGIHPEERKKYRTEFEKGKSFCQA